MNISFSLTTEQFKARTKDVTRRLGWERVKAGWVLGACEKCQGLKKGEHPIPLGKIRVVSARREPLDLLITQADYGVSEVRREGFPEMTPLKFVAMFCAHNRCQPDRVITRIEFEYL